MDRVQDYRLRLVCPKCGRSGTAVVTEMTVGGVSTFNVDHPPLGFHLKAVTRSRAEAVFGCECGAEFPA